MATLIMANDEDNPIFHDFLGTSCSESAAVPAKIRAPEASASVSVGASSGAHGFVSATSDLGSERQAENNLDGVQGSKSDISGPEISKGRKRTTSDSAFMGSLRDRMHQTEPLSPENMRLLKMFQNEAGGERSRRSDNDESAFAMRLPRPNFTNPFILQPPISSRPELVVSNRERSIPVNAGPIMYHHPSRLGQFAAYVDKFSSNRYKDTSVITSHITQPAADEGSRTGIKGSGLLNVTNATCGAPERNPTGVLLSSSGSKADPQNSDTQTFTPTSRQGLASTTRQMTIFYAGQAHVFDDVHPTKADAIMALAGSSGGSWSTTYLPRSNVRPPLTEAYVPRRENGMDIRSIAFSQDINGRPSAMGTSGGFSQGGQISITGGHQSVRPARDTRTIAQAPNPNSEGEREV
eukprot:TRINITY_DN1735_c0_g1_i8.p1 TRINITY_DN1735_c0_g1~~TRINITY_DN1735_c0_g1_i8.p1  ORF type:complete len:408 (-),score=54.90 TRINITY_DN1735_c0_g1_i8:243-1466(-)